MRRLAFVVTALWSALVASASCATGTVDDSRGDDGEGAGAAGAGAPDGGGGAGASTTSTTTTTSTSSTTSTSTTTSTTTSTSTCNPPQHLCGGICVGNTPDTGCYQSQSCSPCATPAHGSAICTQGGVCDVSCNAPYVKSGSSCVCPSQCCVDADCGGSDVCDNGTCITPCDPPLCIALCLIQGKAGVCINDVCVCL